MILGREWLMLILIYLEEMTVVSSEPSRIAL